MIDIEKVWENKEKIKLGGNVFTIVGIQNSTNGINAKLQIELIKDDKIEDFRPGDYVIAIDKSITSGHISIKENTIYKIERVKGCGFNQYFVKLYGVDGFFRCDTLKKVEVKL